MSGNYSTEFLNQKGKVSDKWESYLGYYDGLFASFSPRSILEIGVQNGGSLEIWSRVIPSADLILGLDVDPRCLDLTFESPRIRFELVDASSRDSLKVIQQHATQFDLIIDDGSHHSADIINSLLTLLPLVSPGGKYVIEDLHASYWNSWQGGLFRPDSAIAFLKRIVDIVNFDHWDVEIALEDYFAGFGEVSPEFIESVKRIEGIRFQDSICQIDLRKSSHKSSLGTRKFTGQYALVTEAALHLSDTESSRESAYASQEFVEYFLDPKAIARGFAWEQSNLAKLVKPLRWISKKVFGSESHDYNLIRTRG